MSGVSLVGLREIDQSIYFDEACRLAEQHTRMTREATVVLAVCGRWYGVYKLGKRTARCHTLATHRPS